VSRATPPSHPPQSSDTVRNHTVFTETMADVDYSRRNKVPRPISENEKAKLEEFIDSIHYSARSVMLNLFGVSVILTTDADTLTTSSSTDTFNFQKLC
jgi:hypothetical protein